MAGSVWKCLKSVTPVILVTPVTKSVSDQQRFSHPVTPVTPVTKSMSDLQSLSHPSLQDSKSGSDLQIFSHCHDRFLPVGHWFKGGLRVKVAASRRGCCGCAATCCRGEWTRECPMHRKVPRKVHEFFSTDFGSEVNKLSFVRKR